MRIECGTCGKPYEQRVPLLVMRENERGEKSIQPPEPDADASWFATCKHKRLDSGANKLNPKVSGRAHDFTVEAVTLGWE